MTTHSQRLAERLDQGDVLVMDGGTGSEIQRRGRALDRNAWSGTAHRDDPDLVRGIHEDYIRAGAEIVIANSFATARHVLASVGLAEEFEAINRRAIELAREARERAARHEVWIAGSLSSMPPLAGPGRTAVGPELEAGYRAQAEILAEAGADLLVLEMMLDRAGAEPVARAAASVGLPVWIGFSASLLPGGAVIGFRSKIRPDDRPVEPFDALAAALVAIGGQVAGIMHSEVEATGPALDALARHWQGPTLAYAETGRYGDPDWVFEEIVAPEPYAAEAVRWVEDQGVQVVGGCCGTGPDHIRALRERLPRQLSL